MIRKFSFGFLIFTMVMWTLGTGFVPQAQAALTAGDLVKGPNSDAVYYIGADNKKYVFPDAKTYFTWYSDFSAVQTVTVSELDMHADGGTVTYRPGTKLVTTVDTNKVYAVEPGGMLRWITSEADAIALWGANWAQRVQDVIPGFFSATYTVGADLGSTYPTGSLIQMSGDATIYYVDGTEIRPFADGDAFEANGLDFGDVVTVSSLAGYTTGSSITGEESDISSINASSTVTTNPGAVTVSLAADTPATTIVPGNASRVPFTKVNFTNTSNADVTVDQVVVLRGGIGQDAAFTDLDLVNAATSLPLNKSPKSINSLHKATFNDDFVVKANSTMGVILAGNMASSLGSYAGENPALILESVTLKSGSTLSGSLPIAGNAHTLNGTITIGAVTVDTGGQNPSALTKAVGTKKYTVSSIKLTAGSAEKVRVKKLTFTNNGSASASDFKNLTLKNANSGTTWANPMVSGDEFSFDVDVLMDKGTNVTFDLMLDIESGSNRTISMDIEDKADIQARGETYGFNILPSYNTGSSAPFYNANDTTIGNGTLRIESMSVTPTNIAENKTGVTLGKFKFVAKGEQVNVTSAGWTFDIATSASGTSISDVTNVTIYDPNGNAVAGPKDPTANDQSATGQDGTATTTDTISVPVGETIYTVKGDLSADFTTNDTIQVGIIPGAMTAKGEITGNSITPTPAAEVESTTLTIKAAALAVSVDTAPAAQTVVAGTQDFTVANFILDASNSGADIEVTALKPDYRTTGAAFPDLITGWTLWDGANEISIDSDSDSCSGATCSTTATQATTTLNLDDDALVVKAGQSKKVTVKADIGTGATSGTFNVGLHVAANLTVVDDQAQSVTPTITASDGQTMTLAAGGTLNAAIGTDPAASVYVSGTSGNTIGEFSLEAKNEGMQLNSFGFTIADASVGINGDQDELTTLELYDGATLIGSASITGANATITPNSSFTMSKDANKTLKVKATFPNLDDASPASSGGTFTVTLSNIDVDGTSAGSSSVTINPTLSTAFSNVTIYEGVPTIARVAFSGSDTVTANGQTLDVFKHSVTVDAAGGRVGLYKFSYGVTTSTITVSPTGYWLYESSSSGSLGNVLAKGSDFVVTDNPAGTALVEAYFDVNDDSALTPGREHRILEPGVTRYYTLRAKVESGHDGTADNESITVDLAGDAAHAVAGTTQEEATVVDSDTEDDFIWSDLNFSLYSTAKATKTDGWFNGYLLPGLADNSTTAQTVSD